MADSDGESDPWVLLAKTGASVVLVGLALAEPTPFGEVAVTPIVSAIWGIDLGGE